ncbi:hypothetical protein ACKFKG_00905 [Phormidesmis sp. 146-35]
MNLILIAAAIAISVLVFTWLIKVVKATVTTALVIAAIVLILQFVFGIGAEKILEQVIQLIQYLWQTVFGKG